MNRLLHIVLILIVSFPVSSQMLPTDTAIRFNPEPKNMRPVSSDELSNHRYETFPWGILTSKIIVQEFEAIDIDTVKFNTDASEVMLPVIKRFYKRVIKYRDGINKAVESSLKKYKERLIWVNSKNYKEYLTDEHRYWVTQRLVLVKDDHYREKYIIYYTHQIYDRKLGYMHPMWTTPYDPTLTATAHYFIMLRKYIMDCEDGAKKLEIDLATIEEDKDAQKRLQEWVLKHRKLMGLSATYLKYLVMPSE